MRKHCIFAIYIPRSDLHIWTTPDYIILFLYIRCLSTPEAVPMVDTMTTLITTTTTTTTIIIITTTTTTMAIVGLMPMLHLWTNLWLWSSWWPCRHNWCKAFFASLNKGKKSLPICLRASPTTSSYLVSYYNVDREKVEERVLTSNEQIADLFYVVWEYKREACGSNST